MLRERTHTIPLAVLVLAAGAWLAGPAGAAESDSAFEPAWRLRFQVSSIDFDGNFSGGSGYDVDVGGAVSVNAEYRFSPRLGLDLGALAGGGVDLASRSAWLGYAEWHVYDTLTFNALTAGLGIHLTPDSRVDFSICPMVAMMQYGGLVVETGAGRVATGVDFDEDLAFGASLGLAVPFGERRSWTFNANLTRLESTMNGSGSGGLRVEEDYDATLFGLGFGYRF